MDIQKIFLLTMTTGLLVACSGSTEDVRITLCKDLVSELNAQVNSPSWDKENVEFNGYEDMEVALNYSQSGLQGEISCFYPYDAVEENAMTHSDPASAHATYPSAVIFNGQKVESKSLSGMVKNVLIKQGNQAIDKGKQMIDKGTEAIKTSLE